MQIHQLKPKVKPKKKKRIGRGGKKGTYSGKGVKGQKSRAGRKFQPIIRNLIKRYPKLRGYQFKPNKSDVAVVNLFQLQKKFEENELITPKSLLQKRLIRKIKGKVPQVKILAKGEIDKKLVVKECQVSKSAKEKIEKAGGKII
jgi:large subunit ribosomal protein L15